MKMRAVSMPMLLNTLATASATRLMTGVMACSAGIRDAAILFFRYSALADSCDKVLFALLLPCAIFWNPSPIDRKIMDTPRNSIIRANIMFSLRLNVLAWLPDCRNPFPRA